MSGLGRWEEIDDYTNRLKVPGGWVIEVTDAEKNSQAICFVPDPNWEWDVVE